MNDPQIPKNDLPLPDPETVGLAVSVPDKSNEGSITGPAEPGMEFVPTERPTTPDRETQPYPPSEESGGDDTLPSTEDDDRPEEDDALTEEDMALIAAPPGKISPPRCHCGVFLSIPHDHA